MSAPLIHICGWPGCGKRTIAAILRDRIGARLIDNHLILNPASALFERGTPDRSALRKRIRAVLYEAAVGLPPEVPLILTDALAQSDAGTDLIDRSLALARAREAEFVPILLTISEAENIRRLEDPARLGSGKLMDPSILRDQRKRHEVLRLPGVWEVDVTDLSAQDAADQIATRLGHGDD